METKLSVFIDSIHEFEYVRTELNTHFHHSLTYSKGEQWQEELRGKKCLSIVEDKQDSRLDFEVTSPFSLAEAEYFDVLLRLILRNENMPKRVIEISKRELL